MKENGSYEEHIRKCQEHLTEYYHDLPYQSSNELIFLRWYLRNYNSNTISKGLIFN